MTPSYVIIYHSQMFVSTLVCLSDVVWYSPNHSRLVHHVR